MGRAGILYEEVAEAAERMLLAGVSPTLEKLRAQLGAGSYSTLSKHLQSWRMMKQQEPEPASPPDPVGAAVGKVWQEIRLAAEAEIDKVKTESLERVHEAEQKLVQSEEYAQTRVAECMAEIHALKNTCETQANQYQTCVEQLRQAEQQCVVLTQSLEKAQVREKALQEQQAAFMAHMHAEFDGFKQQQQQHAAFLQETFERWLLTTEKHLKVYDQTCLKTHETVSGLAEGVRMLHTKTDALSAHLQNHDHWMRTSYEKTRQEALQWKEQLAACAAEREVLSESLKQQKQESTARERKQSQEWGAMFEKYTQTHTQHYEHLKEKIMLLAKNIEKNENK
jgi:hypothetical protein